MLDPFSPSLPHLLALLQAASPQVGNDGGSGVWGEYLINPFVIAILLFFVYSLVILVRYLWSLPFQRAALRRVRANYERVERDQERDPDIVRNDLLEGVNDGSIVRQRVEELHRISVSGGEFDQLALAEVSAAREGVKVSIARHVASVLVLLGLCGAVWGLSGMVFQMGPALKQVQDQLATASQPERDTAAAQDPSASRDPTAPIQKSFETLINIMSESLANTRSAFFASLTGIITSIVLLLLNGYISREQVAFLAALEDLTATRLIPAFRAPHETAELTRALDSFRDGSNFLAQLSNDLDGKVSQVGTSLDNLFAIVRKFGEGADALHGGQERVYQAQAQMVEVVEEFRDFMSRTEAQQSGSAQRLERVVTAVQEGNQNLTRALDEWQGKHEDLLQLIQSNDEKLTRVAASSRELALQGIGDIADLVRTSLAEQVGALREQALELLGKQHEGNEGHMGQLLARQSEFVTQLQRSVENGDGRHELLDGLSKMVESERAQFAEWLQHLLSRNDESLKAVLGEQKKILDVTGMRRVEERLEMFVSASQAQFSALLTRQEGLDRQLALLGTQAVRLTAVIRLLAGVATVSIPVFAALAVMFTFDLRPETLWGQGITLLAILGVIFVVAWFLREKA